jgi:predicted permease
VDIPLYFDIPMDWNVFAFTLGVAVLVGALFGLIPGLKTTRAGVAAVLKEEAGSASTRSRARSVVVIGQLAFTFVLLIAAGLVGKSLGGALRVDPGFDHQDAFVAMTDVDMARLDDAQSLALAERWRASVATTPDVSNAALVTRAPLSTGNSTNSFTIDGGPGRSATEFQGADWAAVSPQFFATLGIRILAGRGFTGGDVKGSQPVTIISNALAREYFGDAQHAVGRVLRTGREPADRRLIVGVAADTKVRSLDERPRPMMYENLAQIGVRHITLVVKSKRPDIGVVVRQELRRANPAMPIMSAMSYDEFIGVALLPQRMAAIVASTLGAAGLLLAILGVYGIVAYSVAQRTREIGIRMAVGATPGRVVATMAAAGVRLVAIGTGTGLLLAMAGTRTLGGFLLGVSPTDPLTFGAVTLGMAAIAVLACVVPARRAAKVDPLTALRSN